MRAFSPIEVIALWIDAAAKSSCKLSSHGSTRLSSACTLPSTSEAGCIPISDGRRARPSAPVIEGRRTRPSLIEGRRSRIDGRRGRSAGSGGSIASASHIGS
jgi:hypothetical protein